jgi:NADH-quinone oxidoreductase subunit B
VSERSAADAPRSDTGASAGASGGAPGDSVAGIRALLAPLSRWARNKSRVGLAVVGALPGPDAAAFSVPRVLPIGVPTDAPSARQADLLVVVGRVSHKLAPFLVRTHASMAQPSQVLVIDLEPRPALLPRTYASVERLDQILPVDVVLESAHPHQTVIARAIAALDASGARTPDGPT